VIRALSLLSIACIAAAIVLALATGDDNTPIVVVLVLAAVGISILLGIRSGYHKARNLISDARAFVSGDIQTARLVEVGDPKGLFNPESTVVLELEGEDGVKHRFERDVPIPWPVALSYRFGRRFKAPLVGGTDLSEMMAFELRREGLDVEVGRAATEPAVGSQG
jgi:hypothetical protein